MSAVVMINIITTKLYLLDVSISIRPSSEEVTCSVTDCVYKIPCSNCEMTYTGETGRKFGTRLKEHKTEVEATTSKPFTRSQVMLSTGQNLQSWIGSLKDVPDGLRKQCTSERRDGGL